MTIVVPFRFLRKAARKSWIRNLPLVATPEFTFCTATAIDEISVDPFLQSLYLTDSKTMSRSMEEGRCI
jgi:hypothetical protein